MFAPIVTCLHFASIFVFEKPVLLLPGRIILFREYCQTAERYSIISADIMLYRSASAQRNRAQRAADISIRESCAGRGNIASGEGWTFMGILEFREVNCKNCYKCVRNCPVKSIEVIGHQARIIEQECILCGNCSVVCPQKAKSDISELPAVRRLIAEGKTVYALIAPSIAAYFDRTLEELSGMLRGLGFTEVVETAVGARLVKREYERLVDQDPGKVFIC